MGTHRGRARSPPHISDGRRLVLEGCVFVLFFRSISVECASPLNGTLKQKKQLLVTLFAKTPHTESEMTTNK